MDTVQISRFVPGPRAVLLGLAVPAIAGACWPEAALAPFTVTMRTSRHPAMLLVWARWLFVAASALCVLLAWGWPAVCRAAARAVDRLEAAPGPRFWLGLAAAAAIPRALLAALLTYPLLTDSLWYHRAALSLAAGDGFAINGHPTAYRFPGYPLLLAAGYRLVGPRPAVVWFWGLAATAALVAGLYRIARQLYGERVARVSAVIAALYPALILHAGSAMSDLPFAAGVVLWTALMLRAPAGSPLTAVLGGLGTAALAYVRGQGLALVALAPLLWRLQGQAWRRQAAPFALLAATVVLSIAPWVARNYACFGMPAFGTNLGVNLYIGNRPGAGVDIDYDARPTAGSGASRANEAERSRLYAAAAVDSVRQRPLAALALVPVKLVQLYLPETGAVTAWFQRTPPPPAWARFGLYGLTQLAYWALLGVLGFRLAEALARPSARPRGVQRTGYAVALVFTAVCLVFFGSDRFRLPIMPWLFMEAAVVLAQRPERQTRIP